MKIKQGHICNYIHRDGLKDLLIEIRNGDHFFMDQFILNEKGEHPSGYTTDYLIIVRAGVCEAEIIQELVAI